MARGDVPEVLVFMQSRAAFFPLFGVSRSLSFALFFVVVYNAKRNQK